MTSLSYLSSCPFAARSAPKFDCGLRHQGKGASSLLDLHVHLIALERLAGRKAKAVEHLKRERVEYTVSGDRAGNGNDESDVQTY